MDSGYKESPGCKNLRLDLKVGMKKVFVEEIQKCVSS